jgi:hypothetical protein
MYRWIGPTGGPKYRRMSTDAGWRIRSRACCFQRPFADASGNPMWDEAPPEACADYVQFPGGGFEAETQHLKRCIRAGICVQWVPIPAIYEGAPNSFRPIRDVARVTRAALTP